MTLLPPASLLMQFVKDPTDHTNRQGTRMKIFYTDSCDHAAYFLFLSNPINTYVN